MLFTSVSPILLTFFVLSVVLMNLFANKSIDLNPDIFALDMGITISWLSFLIMDVIVYYYGQKAGNIISVFALLINFIICLIMFLISYIPGIWSQAIGIDNVINDEINKGLDETFRGSWFITFGSSIAFISSSILNNFLNTLLGKVFKKDPNKIKFNRFIFRTYISTMISQFVDNLLFSLIVSLNLFKWKFTQCVLCSLTGMAIELLMEILFSFFGYRILKYFDKQKQGNKYLLFMQAKSINRIDIKDIKEFSYDVICDE